MVKSEAALNNIAISGTAYIYVQCSGGDGPIQITSSGTITFPPNSEYTDFNDFINDCGIDFDKDTKSSDVYIIEIIENSSTGGYLFSMSKS